MNVRPPLAVSVITLLLAAVPAAEARKAEVSSLSTSDIREFADQPTKIQQLLKYSLGLTRKKLAYQYGSCDPSSGGMDCSGVVHHILNHHGLKAPRQSNTLYLWVQDAKNLRKVRGAHKVSNPQLKHIKPGDLLFWEGTYNVGKRNPPTSHVMIFLGHRKSDGKPVMVGASSGRYYDGRARHGVSVFDFTMPRTGSTSSFVGYGPIPGLERASRSREENQGRQPVLARVMERIEERVNPPEPTPKPASEPKKEPKSSPEPTDASPPISEPEVAVVKPESEPTPADQSVESKPAARLPQPAKPGLGGSVLNRLKRMESELKELKSKLEDQL